MRMHAVVHPFQRLRELLIQMREGLHWDLPLSYFEAAHRANLLEHVHLLTRSCVTE